ncbi:MAG: hypothetical protein JST55_15090 [Bacteroidetes bacterium]|nr:hypothetical protein [Bacteroidota bacterium]
MSVLITKILPENLISDSHLVKPELVTEKLYSQKNKKLLLLNSPKGFGKSCALSLFVTEYILPYSYYKTDEEDVNLYIFLNYLIHSIDKVIPGFIDEMKVLLDYYKPDFNKKEIRNINSLSVFTRTLINNLYTFCKEEFYIIIEDAEQISEFDWAHSFFDYFIEHSPKNIHFIFVTSSKYPFDYVKIKMKRNYFELTHNDLRADACMVKKISESVYSLNLSREQISHICEKTEGWLTGIHILLQSLSSNTNTPDNFSLSDTMSYFFQKEIIEGIDEKYINILFLSSLFESFNEELLEKLSGRLSKGLNVKSLLEILKEKYNFVLKAYPAGGYEYLIFFKEFLSEKAPAAIGHKQIKQAYSDAGSYYLSINDVDRAIKYYALAEDYKKIIPVVLECIPQLSKDGDLNIADKMLSTIPDSFYVSYPLLIYWKGIILKNYFFDYENATNAFDSFLKLNAKAVTIFTVKAVCHIAEIKFNSGEGKKAISYLEDYKTKVTNKKLLPSLLLRLSSFYFNSRILDKVSPCCIEALTILGKNKDSESTAIRASIQNNLGNLNFMKGDFNEAKICYKKSLNDLQSLYHKIQTTINIFNISCYSGDFKNAGEELEGLLRIKIVNLIPELRIQALEASSNYHLEYGNFAECLKQINLLEGACRELENFRALITALTIKCKIYYYENNIAELKKQLKLINELRTHGLENDLATADLFDAILSGKEEKAIKLFDFFIKNDLASDKIFFSFRLAELVMKKNKEKFLKYYTEAVNESFRIRYFNVLVTEVTKKRSLLDCAVNGGLDKDTISEIYTEIISRNEDGNLCANITDIQDIYLVTNGVPAFFIRGVKVDDKKWTRAKFKEMFLYLFINRKNYVTKDILIDEFFKDSDQSYSDNIFHQFLSNLRSILKNYGNIEYVTYENKMFEFNPGYMYDSDIERLKYYSKKQQGLKDSSPEKEAVLKKAAELFKDIFMKGYYVPWVEELRSRVDTDKVRLIKELIKILESKNSTGEAIEYYNLLLEEDDLNEDLYYKIITAYAGTGEINTAKAKYKIMLDKFEKELGEKPSAQFLKKIKDVLLN